jgi:hypothetical protein
MIESVREADVGPQAVFALYANPDTWSRWGHNATRARASGPLVEGGTVEVRAGYGTVYRCLIRRLEPGRALELVVRPALMTIVKVYEVEPTEHGARIRHAFEVSGPLARVTRLVGLDRRYQVKLDEEVAAVARIAANPGADPGSGDLPSRQVSLPERVWHGLGRAVRGGRERQNG